MTTFPVAMIVRTYCKSKSMQVRQKWPWSGQLLQWLLNNQVKGTTSGWGGNASVDWVSQHLTEWFPVNAQL